MTRFILAAELGRLFEPERERIRAEMGWELADDEGKRLIRTAEQYAYAIHRVTLEEWDDSPYNTPWVEAYRRCWQEEKYGVEPDFHRFGVHYEAERIEWLEAHPEWEQERNAQAAADAGRLF